MKTWTIGEVLQDKPAILARVDRCTTSKTIFYSKDAARAALATINPSQRTPMSAFRCAFCGHWHVGHRRGSIT